MSKKTKVTHEQIGSLQNVSQLAEYYIEQEKIAKFKSYKHEAGVIVSEKNLALSLVKGNFGSVDFPEEQIWALHKARPGCVLKLAHTHPPRMDHPSGRDLQTLETWAWAFHPFPARLSVITLWNDNQFVEKTYLATVQSKEEWLKNGKGVREVYKELETVKYFRPTLLDQSDPSDAWLLWIIKESYGKEKSVNRSNRPVHSSRGTVGKGNEKASV